MLATADTLAWIFRGFRTKLNTTNPANGYTERKVQATQGKTSFTSEDFVSQTGGDKETTRIGPVQYMIDKTAVDRSSMSGRAANPTCSAPAVKKKTPVPLLSPRSSSGESLITRGLVRILPAPVLQKKHYGRRDRRGYCAIPTPLPQRYRLACELSSAIRSNHRSRFDSWRLRGVQI